MKTPDKIKNGLDHCAHAPDGLCKGCPYNDDCYIEDGFSVIAHDALEYIHSLENHISELTEKVAQLEAAQPKWISVKEKLPNASCIFIAAIHCPKGDWIEIETFDHEEQEWWHEFDTHRADATEKRKFFV